MTPDPLAALLARWRAEADRLGALGALVDGERLMTTLIGELEAEWRAYLTEPLTVAQAAAESGYSGDHLREMVRTGGLRHIRPKGDRGHIRVRRCDLPRKADSAGLRP